VRKQRLSQTSKRKSNIEDKIFQEARKKLTEEYCMIRLAEVPEMVIFLDEKCSLKVTPSTMTENPGFVKTMYLQNSGVLI